MIKQLIIKQLSDWIGADYKKLIVRENDDQWIGFADPMCGPHNLETKYSMGPFREMRFAAVEDQVIVRVVVDSTVKDIISVNYADPQFLTKLQAIVEHGKMWASFKKPYPTPTGTELI